MLRDFLGFRGGAVEPVPAPVVPVRAFAITTPQPRLHEVDREAQFVATMSQSDQARCRVIIQGGMDAPGPVLPPRADAEPVEVKIGGQTYRVRDESVYTEPGGISWFDVAEFYAGEWRPDLPMPSEDDIRATVAPTGLRYGRSVVRSNI